MKSALVTVAAYGKDAGSARVRIHDWVEHFGLDVTHHTYLDSARLGVNAVLRRPYATTRAEASLRTLKKHISNDTLFLSRRASPLSSGALEASLLRSARRGIYDFDDALYASTQCPFPAASVWKRSLEAADLVICGNAVLAENAREYTDRIIQIPSCIHPDRYLRKGTYEVGVPTAVWIGTPGTEKYLATISDALLEAHSKFGLRVKLISAGSGDLGPLCAIVDRIPWTPTTFPAQLASADFGIMPLADDEWSRGKCAYKLLQYGATGLPMIGSPVGVNKNVLKDAHGWAPRNNEEWFEALAAVLSETPDERQARGLRGLATVRSAYSFEAWSATWLEAVFPGSSQK